MFIGFLGPPMSGKTTIAALVFAELKKRGYPAEFIAEKARWHIAYRKHIAKRVNIPQITLLQAEDHEEIMACQKEAEEVMTESSPDSIVIADSCVLNSYFYQEHKLRDVVPLYTKHDSLLYFSDVLPTTQVKDFNRIHSLDEAREISAEMRGYVTSCIYSIKTLTGNIDMRVNEVLQDIYRTYNGG